MDEFRASLNKGGWPERVRRAASIRSFIGAKADVLVPKLAILNLDRCVGLGFTAHITVQVCDLVSEQRALLRDSRRPRFNINPIRGILAEYRPEPEECQVQFRQTDKFDDPQNDFEIIVDILALLDYLDQVTVEYRLDSTNCVKEEILVILLNSFGSICRSNYNRRVSNLPGRSVTSPEPAPESCASLAFSAAPGRSGSSSPAAIDPRYETASQLTVADVGSGAATSPRSPSPPRGGLAAQGTLHSRAAEGEDGLSETEWAKQLRNFIRATDKLSAKVVLFNISKATQSDCENLAKIFLELFIVARQEWEKTFCLNQYLSKVSRAIVDVLRNSRGQNLSPSKPWIGVGCSTQVDGNSSDHIVIDLQNFETVVDTLHSKDRQYTRVAIIRESLQILSVSQEGGAESMEDTWDDYSFEGNSLPPPPPESYGDPGQVACRPPMGVSDPSWAPLENPFGGLGGQGTGGRPFEGDRSGIRYGGPKLNLPLFRNIADVETFLLKFERIMDHFGITDRDRVLYFEQCVEGSKAEAWLTNYLRNYNGQRFAVVVVAFKKAFCSVDESRKLRALVKSRSWKPGESVSDYFIDKMVLLSKYSPTMTLSDRIDHIKDGLPNNWKLKLVGMSFKSMEDMLDYLVLVEADLLEIRRGAELVGKTVSLQEPTSSAAANAVGIEGLIQNFEKLTTCVAALQDELREVRRRPSTPHNKERGRVTYRDRSYSGDRSGYDRGRERAYSGDRSGYDRGRDRAYSGDRSRYDRGRDRDRTYNRDRSGYDRGRGRDRSSSGNRQRSGSNGGWKQYKDDRGRSNDRNGGERRSNNRTGDRDYQCKCGSRSNSEQRDSGTKGNSYGRDRSKSPYQSSKNGRT